MQNTIATRVYDFLKNYNPFNLLGKQALMEVAEGVAILYFEPNQIVFRQEVEAGEYFYIIREGAVQLLLKENDEDLLVDECEEGDIFGLRPLLAENTYAFTAVAKEESLLYGIPIMHFSKILQENPRVAWYMAKAMATDAGKAYANLYKGRLFLEQDRLIDSQFQLVEIQSLETSKAPVTCPPGTIIRNAALIMSDNEVGSIIVVDENGHPLGIVTDRDLRKKVVTGRFDLAQPIADIMTSPVTTVAPEVTVADVQIEMVRHRVHHLCVTEDGTPQSKVLGVLSEHDLLVVQGNNPAILVRETLRSRTPAEIRRIRERSEKLLERYIYQEVSIAYICTVMTEVNDMLIRRTIDLCIDLLAKEGKIRPDVPFCWLSLGSAGRKEQLLRTDQDSALLFANVQETDYPEVQRYYINLAQKVTEWLYDIGFAYCPGKMMASNPKWCMSLDRWKEQFTEWIIHPNPKNVRYCTIFIDYRAVYGNAELTDGLTQHIFKVIDRNPSFLSFLAKSALENPPPLSFFRNFVVERSGEHKDEFDIKKRAMVPLADAARVLIMDAKVGKINNTFQRFEKLAEVEEANRELFQAAADAYEILIRYRTLQGLKNKTNGRYFNPEELSKMERLNLRNSFRPIRELQTLLTLRFQVSYLR
jgi:CBS domain-containing protein